MYFFWSAQLLFFGLLSLFSSFVVFYLFLWCFVFFLLFFVGVDFTIFIDNCCCECGFWGGHLYRDFGGLCFFGRNGCFVVVDVYFTVFVAFDVALKTEIDQRQKSSKNVINRVLLLHDGITWLHYYTKPNEKK